MKTIIDQIHQPEFGKQVLAHLERRFNTGPDNGDELIGYAGGAVAAQVIELLGLDIPVAYNDLDVWRFKPHGEFANSKVFSYERMINGYGVESIYKTGYIINGVKREGLINTMTVNTRYMCELVNGFDINSIAVGVTCTGELVFTKAFESFLYRPQLKVQTYCTPSHSFIRLLSKSKDLGLPIGDGEIDRLIDCLSIEEELRLKERVKRCVGLFGYEKKCRLLSVMSKQELHKLGIKVEPTVIRLRPRGSWSVRHGAYDPMADKSRTRCFFQLKLVRPRNIVERIGRDHSEYDRAKIAERLIYMRMHFPMNLPIALSIPNFDDWQLVRLCAFNFSGSTAAMWTRYRELSYRHPEISSHEVNSGNTLGMFIRNLTWLENHCPILIGMIAGQGRPTQGEIVPKQLAHWERLPLKELSQHAKSFMESMKEAKQNHSILSLSSEIELSSLTEGKCEEMCTEYDLTVLGSEQKHCVGGYFHRLQHSADMIFRCVTSEEVTTLHLKPVYCELLYTLSFDEQNTITSSRALNAGGYVKEYRIAQHMGYRNEKPTQANCQLATSILKRVNQYSAHLYSLGALAQAS
jgi:hypothetical protein